MADELSDNGPTTIAQRHLTDILEIARRTTLDDKLEPPLNVADVAPAMTALRDDIGDDAPREIIEIALRSVFYELAARLATDSSLFSSMWNLLDVSQALSDFGLCELGLPFWLVEELLESQTIEGCRSVFDYLESRRERMITNFDSKQLIVLRFCNELLRRLSRAEDTVFCGRVFIFLFQCFPLSDRSSVNLRGEYHTENRTVYEEKLTPKEADEMDIDVTREDDKQKTATEAESTSLEALYPIFWSLQNYFSDPTQLFKPGNLASFKNALDMTVKKFQQIQAAGHNQPIVKANEEVRKDSARSHDDVGDSFNPKYLTSPDLFELELNELTFRRHILVQTLILLDFLLSLTAEAKAKLANTPNPNRSVVYSFVLSPTDTEWAMRERARLTVHLQQSPDGKFYHRMVDTILTRDKNWVRWKLAGCPSFELAPIPPAEIKAAQEKAENVICRERRLKPDVMGAVSLNFLSTMDAAGDSGLEKLSDPSRVKVPRIGELVTKMKTEELDQEMIRPDDAEAMQASKDAILSLRWRALRVAAKSTLPRSESLAELSELRPL